MDYLDSQVVNLHQTASKPFFLKTYFTNEMIWKSFHFCCVTITPQTWRGGGQVDSFTAVETKLLFSSDPTERSHTDDGEAVHQHHPPLLPASANWLWAS